MLYTFCLGFSLITIEFPDQDKYLAWAEAAAGMGLAIGPPIASFIFNFTNYFVTFLIFGSIIALGTLVIQIKLPSSANKANPSEGNESIHELDGSNLTYAVFLKNSRCLMTLLACLITQLLINFLDAILA